MDCCRGFVAPNTGDRLCGATVCVVSVPILSPWWDTTISLIFEAHLPSSPSDHPEHLQQVVTGEIIHCLTALEVIVWSALSSLVEPERMIVTTWKTNHLVLCLVLPCWLYSLRNQWWHQFCIRYLFTCI